MDKEELKEFAKLDLGKRLKESRMQLGISQTKAAYILGVAQKVLSNWENDVNYPSPLYLKLISTVYNVSVDYLLDIPRDVFDTHDKLTDADDINEAVMVLKTFSPDVRKSFCDLIINIEKQEGYKAIEFSQKIEQNKKMPPKSNKTQK